MVSLETKHGSGSVSAYFLCVDGGSKCLESCAFVKVAVYIVLYTVVDWIRWLDLDVWNCQMALGWRAMTQLC